MATLPLHAARGELLQFEYPERNLIGLRPRWRRRTIIVHDVIDTARSPVPARWYRKRPFVRRGRYLIVGYDLDRRAPRQFYVEAMRGCDRPCWLSLALFDPCVEDPAPLRPDGPYAPTLEDRRYLADVIRHYNRLVEHRPDIWLSLGVFPWDPTNDDSRACTSQA